MKLNLFQAIDIMTSNARGMISGGFRNRIHFWHHFGAEAV